MESRGRRKCAERYAELLTAAYNNPSKQGQHSFGTFATRDGPCAELEIVFAHIQYRGPRASSLSDTSIGRDRRVCRRALAELSPIVHEVPALLKEVAAPISGLDRVAFFEIGRRAEVRAEAKIFEAEVLSLWFTRQPFGRDTRYSGLTGLDHFFEKNFESMKRSSIVFLSRPAYCLW